VTIDEATTETLPPRVGRRDAAMLVKRHFFPVSHRTLERAPLTWRHVNGKALVETAELFQWARAKLAEATPIRGGRRAMQDAA